MSKRPTKITLHSPYGKLLQGTPGEAVLMIKNGETGLVFDYQPGRQGYMVYFDKLPFTPVAVPEHWLAWHGLYSRDPVEEIMSITDSTESRKDDTKQSG